MPVITLSTSPGCYNHLPDSSQLRTAALKRMLMIILLVIHCVR